MRHARIRASATRLNGGPRPGRCRSGRVLPTATRADSDAGADRDQMRFAGPAVQRCPRVRRASPYRRAPPWSCQDASVPMRAAAPPRPARADWPVADRRRAGAGELPRLSRVSSRPTTVLRGGCADTRHRQSRHPQRRAAVRAPAPVPHLVVRACAALWRATTTLTHAPMERRSPPLRATAEPHCRIAPRAGTVRRGRRSPSLA